MKCLVHGVEMVRGKMRLTPHHKFSGRRCPVCLEELRADVRRARSFNLRNSLNKNPGLFAGLRPRFVAWPRA